MQERSPAQLYSTTRLGLRLGLACDSVHIKEHSHNSQEYNLQTNRNPNPNLVVEYKGAGGHSFYMIRPLAKRATIKAPSKEWTDQLTV